MTLGFCVALFVAPREKAFQSASVAVDGTVGQPLLSHLKNHVIEDCRSESIDGHGHIKSFGNCVKMLFVSCYGFVFNSSRCDCWNVNFKNFSESCLLGVPHCDTSHEIPPLEYLIFRWNTRGLKGSLEQVLNVTKTTFMRKNKEKVVKSSRFHDFWWR